MQTEIFRNISIIGRGDHTSPFFYKIKILKLFDLFDMKILLYVLAYNETFPLIL